MVSLEKITTVGEQPHGEQDDRSPEPRAQRRTINEIRPLLQAGEARTALRTGTPVLFARTWKLLCEKCPGTPLERVGGGIVVGLVVAQEPAVLAFVVPVGVVAWVLGAWMFSPRPEGNESPVEEADEGQEERSEALAETGEQRHLEGPAGLPELTRRELAVALHEVGSPHAHISALAEHLHTSPERVREGCRLAAIPIAGGARMKGRGVSTGVRAADFPPLPSAQEEAQCEGETAGQASNNNSNNNVARHFPGGVTVISEADAMNPHRTHVQVITERR